MQRTPHATAWMAILCLSLGLLTACGGQDDAVTSSASSSASSVAPGPWSTASIGSVILVKLSDLKPTQGGLGYDQIYYKLGRYELVPSKKFDDFCADTGMTGVATSTTSSSLSDASSFSCTLTDTSKRDTTVLPTVVVGPNGSSLYLTDGHHGMSTYYEVADGGPNLVVPVLVKNNFSAYSGSAFWTQMSSNNYLWLKDGNDNTITPDKLPSGLGLKNGLQNDVYRSLVYFTRDVGYSKPSISTDFLEFYWAEWLRANSSFKLASFDLSKLNSSLTDPVADTGYLGAVWNASLLMVAASDPIIAGKTGADLGKLASINAGSAYNKGTFGDLSKAISNSKPGKIAYTLNYKTAHGL
ncbi:ParB/Srx family N-terminal domain-containing protein [Uliginosibacterium sediminicola]|uniref:ParB/Srx family N-terminal domain-containing protein n=1 Tax=Uliginosibacterium sediminicola TaxID=2024550 RepID=A0ABU9Z252_9RHOO